MKKKKKFVTYKELVMKRLELNKLEAERKQKEEIVRMSNVAIDLAKQLDIAPADMLNSMGMYRFGIKYEGSYANK